MAVVILVSGIRQIINIYKGVFMNEVFDAVSTSPLATGVLVVAVSLIGVALILVAYNKITDFLADNFDEHRGSV